MCHYPDHVDVHDFPDVRIHQTTAPETVVVEMRGIGRLVETDSPFDMTYIAAVTVKDGRITSYRDYWNPLAVSQPDADANALDKLPAGAKDAYLNAGTQGTSHIFLTGAILCALAFLAALFVIDIPLKKAGPPAPAYSDQLEALRQVPHTAWSADRLREINRRENCLDRQAGLCPAH